MLKNTFLFIQTNFFDLNWLLLHYKLWYPFSGPPTFNGNSKNALFLCLVVSGVSDGEGKLTLTPDGSRSLSCCEKSPEGLGNAILHALIENLQRIDWIFLKNSFYFVVKLWVSEELFLSQLKLGALNCVREGGRKVENLEEEKEIQT